MQNYWQLRWVCLSVGWLGTALGVAGAFLPVLPTTPFLLVAAWGFGRSSPVLHDWLLNHPRFGSTLRGWYEYGAISFRIKVVALAGLASSVVAVYSMTPLALLRIIHVLVVVATTAFILTRPSPARLIALPATSERANSTVPPVSV